MARKRKKELPLVKCDNCGYYNHKYNVDHYGTCTRCRHTLNKKAEYNYEMSTRLKLWRYKSNKGRYR